MEIFTVAFFGHRLLRNPIALEQKLDDIIRHLISSHEYVDFLVGRDGDFDQLAASAVRRCRRAIGEDNTGLTLVLPYETAQYRKNQASFHTYYSDVLIFGTSSTSHFKAAHQRRNREMADRADLILCCIEHKSGGAWQAVKYAQGRGKTVINLADNSGTSYTKF